MSRRVRLPQRLRIGETEQLLERLRGVLAAHTSITLDARALTDIDTAGVQLLLAFVREARERAVALQWEGAGEVLLDASRLLGLTGHLGLVEEPIAPRDPGADSAKVSETTL